MASARNATPGNQSQMDGENMIVTEEPEEDEVMQYLAAHRRMSKENSATYDDTVKHVLQLVKKNSYAAAEEILRETPELNMSYVDNLGKTALHYAASSGALATVTLLLQRKAPINVTDKAGQTALHYAAVRGNDEIIHELVSNGGYVDYPDSVKGRTALHFAVVRNKVDTVQFLLYCGADVTITDKEGKSPIDLSKNESMKKTLDQARATSTSNELGEIQLESVNIENSVQKDFRQIGMSVTCNDMEEGRNFKLMCRKQAVEHTNIDFKIKEQEEVCSDVFTFRLGQGRPPYLNTTLAFPLFSVPETNEELVVKTDSHHEILMEDVYKDKNQWMGSIREDLTSFKSIIVVCRPKIEKFEIGREAVKVTPSAEEGLELDIPANTFQQPVTLSISVTEPPSVEMMESQQYEEIISTSSFYSIDAGGATPEKEIAIKVPLPSTYTGKGNIVVLTMDDEEEDESVDSWKILDDSPVVAGNRITFSVSSFCVKVAVETPALKEVAEKLKLKRELSAIYRRSRRREYHASFLSMTKSVNGTDTFKIVVECCLTDKLPDRKAHWMMDDYQDQRPSESATFSIRAKQRFRVNTSDTIKILGNTKYLPLEFHPRRENHLCFSVEIADDRKVGTGHIEVTMLHPKNMDDDTLLENEPGEILVCVPISLQRQEKRRLPSAKIVELKSEIPVHRPGTIFFEDSVLKEIFEEIQENDWYRIFVLMGISFKELEETLMEEGTIRSKITQLSKIWRDRSKGEINQGMPDLLSALFKSGRRNLAATIQIRLREWYKNEKSKSKFHTWVTKAYRDSNELVPANYPTPMSDSYLVLLADDLLPSNELAKALDIKKSDMNNILGNRAYNCDGLKVMKLLTIFRKNVGDLVGALRILIAALEQLDLKNQRSYAVMCTKAWLKRNKSRNDKFRKEIDQLMSEIN